MMEKINLETFLPYRLAHIAELVSRDLHDLYSRVYDLTVPEWRVLMALGASDKMTAKEIGKYVSMHKTKISRAVRTLEKRRWLVRQENRMDRREEYLSLTARGHKIHVEMIPLALQFQKKLFSCLGRDSDKFQKLLERFEKYYSSM